RGADEVHEGNERARRDRQRERRLDRHGPPAGRHRGDDPRHPDRRTRAPQAALWPRDALRWRRHGHRDDRGAAVERMSIKFEKDPQGIVTLTFDAPNAPVNTMTAEWQAAFTQSVERLASEKSSTRGVILASAKKTFFAGAELKDVLKFGPDDGPQVFHWIEAAKKPMRALEKLGIPVVAALEGTALGGGWEIALCAHCRIALDDPSIQLGLPEVTLGLLPGAGGVTKTVRLLGLQAAFPYLVEGKTMRPQEAAKLGLVQRVASNRDDLFGMAREWINANPARKQPWDDENYRMPGGGPSSPKVSQMLSIAPAMVMEKTRGVYPAPKAILAAMVEGAYVDF